MVKWLATAMLSGILAMGVVGCDKPKETPKKDTTVDEKDDAKKAVEDVKDDAKKAVEDVEEETK